MNDETKEIRTQLRLPARLHAAIVEYAQDAGRSMNAEIVQRLEASFPNIEEELLSQRLHEKSRLKMALYSAQSELDRYLARRAKRDWEPFGQAWLDDVIRRGQDNVQRLDAMLVRVESDIDAAERGSF